MTTGIDRAKCKTSTDRWTSWIGNSEQLFNLKTTPRSHGTTLASSMYTIETASPQVLTRPTHNKQHAKQQRPAPLSVCRTHLDEVKVDVCARNPPGEVERHCVGHFLIVESSTVTVKVTPETTNKHETSIIMIGANENPRARNKSARGTGWEKGVRSLRLAS